jgi:uncharacterized metal-binding protein YceD (DUF177 family)
MAAQNETAAMRIQVGSLSDGIHTHTFEAESSELALGENFTRQVVVDVRLDKSGGQIYLTAAVRSTGKFLCDRCTAEFTRELPSKYHMYYVWDPEVTDRFDPAEVQVISPSLNVIDISEDVRQTALLSVPLKVLCGDTCRGLCPHCGKNRNLEPCECRDELTDSRWDKLRALRDGTSS